MILELAFNVALIIFFVYCYFYVGATVPKETTSILGAAQWSQILIVLLVFFLAINTYKVYKSKGPDDSFKINFNLMNIVKSKLFIGSVILLIYSFALDKTGFIITSLVLFMVYSRLLGEKRIKILVLSSFVSVAVIYIIFQVLLGIMLPRGTGFFRTFALFIESLF